MVQRFKLMIMSGLLMHHSSAKIIKKKGKYLFWERKNERKITFHKFIFELELFSARCYA